MLIREKPVAPEFRHVDQITGRIGDLGDDPLGGDDDIGFPGQIEMVQGTVKAGQFPKPQVVLPGDLVEILIADDVVGLGLAHHGDRGRVHSRARREPVGERPGRPRGVSGQNQPSQQEQGENSPDHRHYRYFIEKRRR